MQEESIAIPSKYAFIARQPILNRSRGLFAYELLFRDGPKGTLPHYESHKTEMLSKNYNSLGIDDISGDKKSFINFLPDTLIHRFPINLSPENIIVEIDQAPTSDQDYYNACEHLKNQGFTLALKDNSLLNQGSALKPLVDIVKVDMSQSLTNIIQNNIQDLTNNGIALVADKVSTLEQFSTCKDLGFDYFQGYFFTQPDLRSTKPLPASKLTLLQLMSESARSSFEIDAVTAIFERDASLSFMLLRFINNPMVNKRFEITSLKHAITYLGEMEVKKFIALLSLATLNDDKPAELLHLSLVRAKFCELLQEASVGRNNSQNGFMIGLFSLLDAILDKDMSTLIEKLPLSDEICLALLGKASEGFSYVVTARAFESALWNKVISQSKTMNVDQKDLHGLYNEAIQWANMMRSTLSGHFPRVVVSDV